VRTVTGSRWRNQGLKRSKCSRTVDQITRRIRENYDRLAHEYAVHLFDELQHKPLDQELLTRFALQTRGRGTVCEIGCGPGHVTRFLSDLQVSVFGLDLSPTMVAEARRLSPGLEFREGDMLALDLPSGSLAGIVAFYAIVNLPSQQLATAFSEMWRSLEPDGLLLLAFHVGDEIVRPDELWGVPLTMAFYIHSRVKIRESLSAAGFTVEEVIEREPYPDVEHQSRRAYIFARKHAAGSEASDA
jgi:SAM-dependent methyltransferase